MGPGARGLHRQRRPLTFCSDRCRMQARRAERAARVDALLADIEMAIAKLRLELRPESPSDTLEPPDDADCSQRP